MASTITLTGDWLQSIGNKRQVVGSGNLGTYATNGVTVTAGQVGLGTIESMLIFPASGYVFEFVPSTGKVKAYREGALTPGGSVTLTDGSRVNSYTPGGGDIKGSDNTDQKAVDQAAKPTNADLIDTLHAVAAGAWAYSEDLEPDLSRNVCILFKGAAGVGSTLPTTTVASVTGTFRGAAQSEDISFDFTGVTAVGADQHRYGYGSKPFSTITSVSLTNIAAPQNDLLIGVGIGSKLGLPTDLDTPAEADVIKITKNAADLPAAGIVDTTNMTVNFGTLADGADVAVVYKEDFDAAAAPSFSGNAVAQAALAEVTNLAALGGVTFRFIAIGT